MENNIYMNDLTGKYYFKQSWFGLILMVEYDRVTSDFVGDDSPATKLWRRAKAKDLVYLNLK